MEHAAFHDPALTIALAAAAGMPSPCVLLSIVVAIVENRER